MKNSRVISKGDRKRDMGEIFILFLGKRGEGSEEGGRERRRERGRGSGGFFFFF